MVDIEDVYMSCKEQAYSESGEKAVISIKDNRRVKVRYIEPPFNKPKWDENITDLRKAEATDSCLGTHTRSLDLRMSKSERFKVVCNNGYSIYQMRGDGAYFEV